MASPLLGYNTNVRHQGQVFHIQTEDSGTTHCHIFTHLFADGGRIIASKKTEYRQFLGTDKYPTVVKRLMKESHKAMFIALRDGVFDGDEQEGAKIIQALVIELQDEEPEDAELDVEALEAAAEARLAKARQRHRPAGRAPLAAGRYAGTRPAAPTRSSNPAKPPESVFGGDLLSEKSLDEVILSYLAEEIEEDG